MIVERVDTGNVIEAGSLEFQYFIIPLSHYSSMIYLMLPNCHHNPGA
jgi:hypothetical protein